LVIAQPMTHVRAEGVDRAQPLDGIAHCGVVPARRARLPESVKDAPGRIEMGKNYLKSESYIVDKS